MTYRELLQGVSSYPTPARAIESIASKRGLSIDGTAIATAPSFRLATADLYVWLSLAPDVSQGGQSYSFTDEQRARFRAQAETVYKELESSSGGVSYGYKGSRL